MTARRALFAFLCLAILLWAALHPANSALPWAILAPFLVFIGLVLVAVLSARAEPLFHPAALFLQPWACRPPPVA